MEKLSENLIPIAQLGNNEIILLIHRFDYPYPALGAPAIQVHLPLQQVSSEWYERYLKFNAFESNPSSRWEGVKRKIEKEASPALLKNINQMFSDALEPRHSKSVRIDVGKMRACFDVNCDEYNRLEMFKKIEYIKGLFHTGQLETAVNAYVGFYEMNQPEKQVRKHLFLGFHGLINFLLNEREEYKLRILDTQDSSLLLQTLEELLWATDVVPERLISYHNAKRIKTIS